MICNLLSVKSFALLLPRNPLTSNLPLSPLTFSTRLLLSSFSPALSSLPLLLTHSPLLSYPSSSSSFNIIACMQFWWFSLLSPDPSSLLFLICFPSPLPLSFFYLGSIDPNIYDLLHADCVRRTGKAMCPSKFA